MNAGKCGENGTLPHCWWEYKLVQSLWKTVWMFLKKKQTKNRAAIPLLAIYPEKTIVQKNRCTPIFNAELFPIARTWKQPRCPSTD